MDQRVADLSRAQLYDLFADKIRRMVRQYNKGSSQSLDDRIQSAWIEFLRCADANQNLPMAMFVPRAMARVRGAVLDAMRADDPLSRTCRLQARKLDSAAHAISGRTGKRATLIELAAELSLSVADVHETLRRVHVDAWVYSIDDIEETEITRFTEHALDILEAEESVQLLLDALESLPHRDREVIELRYYEGLTNREIAKKLRIGESRATALHQRGVQKLRKVLLNAA